METRRRRRTRIVLACITFLSEEVVKFSRTESTIGQMHELETDNAPSGAIDGAVGVIKNESD